MFIFIYETEYVHHIWSNQSIYEHVYTNYSIKYLFIEKFPNMGLKRRKRLSLDMYIIVDHSAM